MALKRREKILLVGALIAIAIFLFDRMFDTPMNRKIQTLRGEVKTADAKLSELALLTRGLETTETEINRLEKELRGLSERTLRGEEFRVFLRHLARSSDPLLLKVISIIPTEELIIPSGENKETSFQGSRKVTIHLVLHSTFSKIESYLKGIEELPFLVQVEDLQIQRTEDIHPLLKVTLNLKMYMILL
jgi:hypothetical protein